MLVRGVAIGDAGEHVRGQPAMPGKPAHKADVTRERTAGERVSGPKVSARPDALLALEPARDLLRVGADRLADLEQSG